MFLNLRYELKLNFCCLRFEKDLNLIFVRGLLMGLGFKF